VARATVGTVGRGTLVVGATVSCSTAGKGSTGVAAGAAVVGGSVAGGSVAGGSVVGSSVVVTATLAGKTVVVRAIPCDVVVGTVVPALSDSAKTDGSMRVVLVRLSFMLAPPATPVSTIDAPVIQPHTGTFRNRRCKGSLLFDVSGSTGAATGGGNKLYLFGAAVLRPN
jgi:hypothetical protein